MSVITFVASLVLTFLALGALAFTGRIRPRWKGVALELIMFAGLLACYAVLLRLEKALGWPEAF